MATVGALVVKLQADISDFAQKMDTAMGKLQRSISNAVPASEAVLGGVTALAAAFGAAGVAGIKLAGDMEQTKMAFTTMLGSAEQADKFIRDLWGFAAKTPFEFDGLAQSSRQLLAFGFQAKEIIPMMTAIGDAVSALGGGAFEIDRVTRALGQMRAKGKVSAEEMMQLAELGIPVWQMLADAIGTSIPEAMEKASKGGIDATTGINAILEGMTKQFKGSMENQSQTLLGMWSTAKDTATGILRSLGQEIIDTFNLKDKLAGAITALQQFSDTLTQFFDLVSQKGLRQALEQMIPEDMQAKIVLVAGAIAGALVPALWSLASSIIAATTPLLPFMAAGMAIAGLAFIIYKNWEPISSFFKNTWTAITTWLTDTWNGISQTAINVWGSITSYLTSVWNSIKTTAQNAWNGIKAFFAEWWETLLVLFAGPLGVLVLLIVKNWETIKNKATEIWEEIKQAIMAPIEFITQWLKIKWLEQVTFTDSTLNKILGFFTNTWNNIKNFLANTWSGIKQMFVNAFGDMVRSAADFGRRIMESLRNAIGSVKLPIPSFSISFSEGPLGVKIPDIDFGVNWRALRDIVPFLAEGGIVTRPTLAMIGERGPEAVVPLDKAGPTSFERMFEGANIYVRSDNDIKLLAREIYNLFQSRARGAGVVT